MRLVVTFVMKEAVACVASALSIAYAAALDTPPPEDGGAITVQVEMIGTAPASLRLDTSGPRPRPVMVVDGVEGAFDAAMCGLLDPDDARRADALLEVEGMVAPAGTIRRDDLEPIAGVVDPVSRLRHTTTCLQPMSTGDYASPGIVCGRKAARRPTISTYRRFWTCSATCAP